MIRRTFRGVVQLLGGLGAALTILMVLVAWQLSKGPISLAFLSPYIESALSTRPGEVRVRLEDTILTWAGWDRTLDIRVINVKAIGPGGEVVATIPELSLSLSAQALFRGILAPKSIELFRPSLRLLRRLDGRIEVGFDEGGEVSKELFGHVLRELLAAPDPQDAMSFLSRLDIVDADLTIEDQRLETSWRAPSADIKLRRDADGIEGEVFLELQVDGRRAQITVLGGYQTAGNRLDLGIGFTGVTPLVFSRIVPELEPLAALDLPLDGTATLSMTIDGTVEMVGFELAGGPGHLSLPGPLAQELKVREVVLKGRYDGATEWIEADELVIELGNKGSLYLPAPTDHRLPLRRVRASGRYHLGKGRLEVRDLDADLGGPTLSLSAVIDGIGGDLEIAAKGALRDLAVDDLARYWPRSWGTEAQQWVVANISAGRVPVARSDIRVKSDGKGGFEVVSLSGDMDIEEVTVDYLSPMPKATKVSATAKFDRERFDVFITRGEAMGLTVKSGSLFFTGLDRVDQFADIELTIVGPARNALELIDHQPLGFATALGIVPSRTSGNSDTHLKLDFIIEHALTKDQVKVSATSELTDFTIAEVVFGKDIAEARLSLKADNQGMSVTGQVTLGGIPATLAWRENFTDKPPFRSRFDLKGRIVEVRNVSDLGIDLDPFPGDFVTGATDTEIRYTVLDDRQGRLHVGFDLTDLTIDLPPLGWKKMAGVAGTAEVVLDLQGDVVRGIPRFEIIAGDLSVNGSVGYAEDGSGLSRIDLNRVAYGRTDMVGMLVPGEDGSWTASFHGADFDLEPMWSEFLSDQPGAAGGEEDGGLRFSLSIDLDRVWLGGERFLRRVVGTFARDGNRWRGMAVESLVGDDAPFEAVIRLAENGIRRLKIRSGDAGATLRTFGYYDDIVGGTLEVDGEFDDTAPDSPLSGKLVIRDYNVVNAPALAKLVSYMSLTGIVEALNGQGLDFDVLEAPFTLRQGLLEVTDAKATGFSLGYTASGRIYTHAEVVDIEGTMVPAYAINSALGNIPILGEILTGGEEGGGIFAATYRMTGSMEDPEITVNPLSALAPGFFRNIFGIFDQGNTTSETP